MTDGGQRPDVLRARGDFLAVQERGRRFRRGQLTLLVLPTSQGQARVGYTVSRKVGGAVVRNRVRRRLRELVRLLPGGLCSACDHVIIAAPNAATASYAQLREDLAWLLAQARHWSQGSSARTAPSPVS